jgi:hypothetical protein
LGTQKTNYNLHCFQSFLPLLKEIVNNYLEDWVKTCIHVKTTEEKYWHKLRLIKEGTEKNNDKHQHRKFDEKATGNLSARSKAGGCEN